MPWGMHPGMVGSLCPPLIGHAQYLTAAIPAAGKIRFRKEPNSIGSLVWEVKNKKIDMTKLPKHHKGQLPRQQGIGDRTSPIMTQSAKQYKRHAIKFAAWCRETYGCRHMADCAPHVQDYVAHLRQQGKSPGTIHTYLAGVCRVFEVCMDDYDLPRRVVAQNTRSRGSKPSGLRKDTTREAAPRLYDFALMVGVRRAEYAALRARDIGEDEVGMYVLIHKGKGGKTQRQRILPCDEDAVRAYFDDSGNYVFSKEEMRNKIDLHALRAVQAQRAYLYFLHRIETEQGYRETLLAQLRLLWEKDEHMRRDNGKGPKHWSRKLYEGTYWLRGENRALAKRLGRPVGYDRLALLAVSVFCLSHWRHDVTVANYLLAKKDGTPDYFTQAE